jgi:predicted PurR-regulated permease PerM
MEIRKYFLLILSCILITLSVWYFGNIFIYIVIAGILSLIGQPIVKFFSNIKFGKFNLPETISAALGLCTLLFIFLLLFVIFFPLIAKEVQILSLINANTAIYTVQGPLKEIEQILQQFHIDYSISDLQSYFQQKLISILTVTNATYIFNRFLAAIGNFLGGFFAISFITFFFLRDAKKIANAITSAVPEKHSEKVKNILIQSEHMLKRYFTGVLIEILLVITFLSIGLSIAGIEHALLIALFAGIVNVIPYVGPLIGTGFAIFVGLTTNPDMTMMGISSKILIVFLTIQIADGVLLQPIIYSNSVKAHPLEIFLVILIGATIGGIGGMILAVPSYTVLRVIAREFFINFRFVKELTKKLEDKV